MKAPDEIDPSNQGVHTLVGLYLMFRSSPAKIGTLNAVS
jgi:hypothetical protein